MHVEEPGKPGRSGLSIDWFEREWDRAKNVWENRWKSAFTPGNATSSGQCSTAGYRRCGDPRDLLPQCPHAACTAADQSVEQQDLHHQRRAPQGCGLLLGHLAVLHFLFALLEPKQNEEQSSCP